MNYIAGNLRFIREKFGLKQSEMLNYIGFAQTTWNNYEKGVSKPKLDDLIQISNKFGISLDNLLKLDLAKGNLIEMERDAILQAKGNPKGNPKGNLNPTKQTINSDLKYNKMLLNEADSPYRSANMPAVVTVAPDGAENIVYVPIKAQAGYLIGHGDTTFIESLPTFHMPGLRNATYRMFEVQGLSMSPTLQDKDRVIAEWVPSVSEIRENRCHVVLTKDGVLVKRLLNRVDERGKIYLKSDTLTHRHEHPIKEIDPSDILEIWYVRLKVSSDLSEPGELYTRVSDLEINMLQIMKQLELSKK